MRPPLGYWDSVSTTRRDVELSGALAFGKTCIVIGPRENVFHCLPQVIWYPDWAPARSALGRGVLVIVTALKHEPAPIAGGHRRWF